MLENQWIELVRVERLPGPAAPPGVALSRRRPARTRDGPAPAAQTTAQLVLRPYLRAHLPTYHEWMQDAALRAATATEEMSAAEEAAAQAAWVTDAAKLSFILFDRAALAAAGGGAREAAGMVGDVNVFLLPDGDAEVSVMVAVPAARRRGLAAEAVAAATAFAAARLGARSFVAKVADDNAPSLALFTTRLGYVEARRVPAFAEVHLRRALPPGPAGAAAAAADAAAVGYAERAFDNPDLRPPPPAQ